MAALGEALKDNHSLRVLSVICTCGAAALRRRRLTCARAAAASDVGDAPLAALAAGLGVNHGLEQLHLSGTRPSACAAASAYGAAWPRR